MLLVNYEKKTKKTTTTLGQLINLNKDHILESRAVGILKSVLPNFIWM